MGGRSTAAEHGPDNNKRLAHLEAGLSALAMALVANGVTVAEGADVHELAISTIKGAAKAHAEVVERATAAGARIEELEKNVTELEAQLTDPASAEEANDGAIATLKARVAELENEVAELETDVADAMNEKNRLANLLADKGTSSTPPVVDEVEEAPAPLAIERGENARDVGPTFGRLTADEIGRKVEDGARFEIAFSNGEFELVEFGGISIAAADLHRFATEQWAVAPTIHIKGATVPMQIAGAGLLLEDEQIAWCAFDPAIRVEPGQERAFNRALIF